MPDHMKERVEQADQKPEAEAPETLDSRKEWEEVRKREDLNRELRSKPRAAHPLRAS